MNSGMQGKLTALIATVVAVGLTACSGEIAPTAVDAIGSPRLAVGSATTGTPEYGKIKVCKSASSNTSGTFDVSRTAKGASTGTVIGTVTIAPGNCVVVAEDDGGNGVGSDVTISETSAGLQSVSAQRIDRNQETGEDVIGNEPFDASGTDTKFVNIFHGFTVTFVNVIEVPPPVCDFITFGRLVTEMNGKKVVISGNAGGNRPGGGILGEFHIEINGVDNHVSTIDSYGPIASGALFGLTNSRVVTGIAKNGNAVELRLWDGGEPGKNTDIVAVKINGVSVLAAAGQYIDQGNMQYHPTCRGPK